MSNKVYLLLITISFAVMILWYSPAMVEYLLGLVSLDGLSALNTIFPLAVIYFVFFKNKKCRTCKSVLKNLYVHYLFGGDLGRKELQESQARSQHAFYVCKNCRTIQSRERIKLNDY